MAAMEQELPSRSSADTHVDLEKGEPRPDGHKEEVWVIFKKLGVSNINSNHTRHKKNTSAQILKSTCQERVPRGNK